MNSGFRADVVQGTIWGVRGRTPIIRACLVGRQSVSAASAVNVPEAALWFMTYKGGMNLRIVHRDAQGLDASSQVSPWC